MSPPSVFEENPYAGMPLEEVMAIVVRYSRGAAVVEEGPTPGNWFLPADCLPVEAPRVATALVLLSAYRRGRGEPWQTLEALHGDLARFSYLPDLDRANYWFAHRSECSVYPVDEAAYVAAQDRYTQVCARLAEDWHAFELDADYMPLYDYLPKELPLPEMSHVSALTRALPRIVCDHAPAKPWRLGRLGYALARAYRRIIYQRQRLRRVLADALIDYYHPPTNYCRLRQWLPASKDMICRAFAIEYALLPKRTKEDYEWYLGSGNILGDFVDEAAPGFYDETTLSVDGRDRERQKVADEQNRLHMRIGLRESHDGLYWMEMFSLMLQAYEIRFGVRPLIEPAAELATPSMAHAGSK